MKLEPYLSPWRKPKCKWTTGLNIRLDSFKMLGEKAVSTRCLTGTGKNFLKQDSNSTENKTNNRQSRSHTKKASAQTAKGIVNRGVV